jgi:nitrous oxidase accessory protein NosD
MTNPRTLLLNHLVLLAIPFILWPVGSEARVWTVNPEGTGDAETIQLAIDAAAPGDTIALAPGTYTEHLLIVGKGLTILGSDGPGLTILDGAYVDRILTVHESGQAVTLEGLILHRGFRNVLEGPGGAVAAYASPLIIRNCIFRDNWALGLGGAVYVTRKLPPDKPGPPAPVGGLTVSSTIFDANWGGNDGGAIFADDGGTQIVGCTFTDNQAVQGAGVGFLHQAHLIRDCRFRNNRSKISGGGVFLNGFASVNLEQTTFEGNAGGDRGGAIRAVSAIQVVLRDCLILENTATLGAGCDIQRTVIHAERTLWRGNSASVRGGGLWIDESSDNGFLRCTWIENIAPRGASISIRSGTMSVEQSILGDPQTKATECLSQSTVNTTCNVGAPTTGDCFGFESRMEIRECDSPTALCAVPSTTCGPAGHTDEVCPAGSCVTASLPSTWGNLKSRYR